MKKKEIFEVLMQSQSDKVDALSEKLKKTIPFEIIKKPEEGLMMFRMQESIENIAFNVGEVLVTQAEVKVENSLGYAMIMGMNKESALNKAFLMGILAAGLPESTEIIDLAYVVKEEKVKKMKEEREIINSTRVKFETMGGQDPNVSHNKKSDEE